MLGGKLWLLLGPLEWRQNNARSYVPHPFRDGHRADDIYLDIMETRLDRGGVPKGGRMTLCGLHLLKGMQVATYSAKSFRMVGQK